MGRIIHGEEAGRQEEYKNGGRNRPPQTGLQQVADHFFQFTLVNSKLTDTVRQFVYSHRILVVLPQELSLGHTCRASFHFTGKCQLTFNGAFTFRQGLQQGR